MQKIDKNSFKLQTGESVTIEVHPVNLPEGFIAIAIAVDGEVLHPSAGPVTKYRFTASTQPGTRHFGLIEASFLGGVPDTARYDLTLSGSYGGEGRLTIRK